MQTVESVFPYEQGGGWTAALLEVSKWHFDRARYDECRIVRVVRTCGHNHRDPDSKAMQRCCDKLGGW